MKSKSNPKRKIGLSLKKKKKTGRKREKEKIVGKGGGGGGKVTVRWGPTAREWVPAVPEGKKRCLGREGRTKG